MPVGNSFLGFYRLSTSTHPCSLPAVKQENRFAYRIKGGVVTVRKLYDCRRRNLSAPTMQLVVFFYFPRFLAPCRASTFHKFLIIPRSYNTAVALSKSFAATISELSRKLIFPGVLRDFSPYPFGSLEIVLTFRRHLDLFSVRPSTYEDAYIVVSSFANLCCAHLHLLSPSATVSL